MRKRPHTNLYTKKYNSIAARNYAEESASPSAYGKKPRLKLRKVNK